MIEFVQSFGFSWVEWLCVYSLPGLLYATLHLAKGYRNRPSQFPHDMLRAIGQEKSIVDRLLNILVNAIAFISIGLGWPLFSIWGIYRSINKSTLHSRSNQSQFNCLPEHLIANVDPLDAEMASYVTDPLGGVPPLPFGHLNVAWGNFLAELLGPDDEMWSFHIPKGSNRGKYSATSSGDIRGFAKVCHGKIYGEFITESD